MLQALRLKQERQSAFGEVETSLSVLIQSLDDFICLVIRDSPLVLEPLGELFLCELEEGFARKSTGRVEHGRCKRNTRVLLGDLLERRLDACRVCHIRTDS
jgi:hypothetical protein